MIQSAAEFIQLRTSEDPNEYRRSAQEDLTEVAWRDLVDNHPEMHIWVVHNKRVPLEILRELARSQDRDIRLSVAMKRKLDTKTSGLLAADSDPGVRRAIAANRKTNIAVLRKLAADPDSHVNEMARERLESSEEQ